MGLDHETRRYIKRVLSERARLELEAQGLARVPGDLTEEEEERRQAESWLPVMDVPRGGPSAAYANAIYDGRPEA